MSITQTGLQTKPAIETIQVVELPAFSFTAFTAAVVFEVGGDDFIADPTWPEPRGVCEYLKGIELNDGLTWQERVNLMRGTEEEQEGID